MAAKQAIHENGRVSVLLQWIIGIAASLVTAGIIAQVAVLWQLSGEISDLKTEIALLNQRNETRDHEHAEIHRRITELERQRDR